MRVIHSRPAPAADPTERVLFSTGGGERVAFARHFFSLSLAEVIAVISGGWKGRGEGRNLSYRSVDTRGTNTSSPTMAAPSALINTPPAATSFAFSTIG
jgi:hypothetical protein